MPILKDTNKPFPLGHFTLYAKGWYENTEDIFEDLKKVLRLDGYSPLTKNDVTSIIVNRYSEYFNVELSDFLSSIQDSEIWKHGYSTKTNDYHGISEKVYDYQTAIVYKIMSEVRFSNATYAKFVIPNYKGELKKPKHISTQRVISSFNKNADYLEWKEKNFTKVLEY